MPTLRSASQRPLIGKSGKNIGIATGPSRLLVVDLDHPKTADDLPPDPWRTRGAASGADVLAMLTADHEIDLPGTYTVSTPSGGRHLYFRQPGQLGNSAGRLGWKIDTRGRGGYVVGARSITTAGHYVDEVTTAPQPLPGWIIEALDTTPPALEAPSSGTCTNPHAYSLAALTGEREKVLAATPGQRNDTLNRAAFALGQLIGSGLLDQHIARDELVSAAGRIGLPRSEAERTITSGITAGTRHPRRRSA